MKKTVEEVLETIWTLNEQGKNTRQDIIKSSEETGVQAALRRMEGDGLITQRGLDLFLTKRGERLAEEIVRRHRLAERLLKDLLQLDEEEYEKMACEFEHILNPTVTDSVCTFLGHPPSCPHDLPIPRGECCKTYKRDIRPLVRPLVDLDIGESGKITYITTLQHKRLDRLSALGVIPGNSIKLHQKKPSFIIQIDETNIAMENTIAAEIYVQNL